MSRSIYLLLLMLLVVMFSLKPGVMKLVVMVMLVNWRVCVLLESWSRLL